MKWLLKAALLADSGSQCLAVFSLPAGRDSNKTHSRPPELSAPASLASWDFFFPLSMGSRELVDAASLHSAWCAPISGGCSRTARRLPERSGKQVCEVCGGTQRLENESA